MSLIESGITPENIQYILTAICCMGLFAPAILTGMFLFVSFLSWESRDSFHSGGSPYGPIGR